MMHRLAAHRPGRQLAFTLVELLVGLALGLLVVLVAGAMLVTANISFAAQTGAAEVDSAGRFALEIIERAARQTAWVDWDRDDAAPDLLDTQPARIGGHDARTLSRATEGMSDPRAGAGAAASSDIVALRFAGAGAGADGDGSMLSCAGFGIGQQDEGWSIFYVAPNASGVAELRCKYKGEHNWSADALVAGVDSFQVLYGLDTDAERDGIANRYVNATAIDALDAGLQLEGADAAQRDRDFRRKTHWKRVASLKLALVLHGARRSRVASTPAVHELFGPGYSAAGGSADAGTRIDESQMTRDLRERERHLFETTILLRNPAL